MLFTGLFVMVSPAAVAAPAADQPCVRPPLVWWPVLCSVHVPQGHGSGAPGLAAGVHA
jgi:hypothetical protein